MNPEIERLVGDGTLSRRQADLIYSHYADSPGDLWSQPELAETTQEFRDRVDRLRGQHRAPVPFDEQEGAEIDG